MTKHSDSLDAASEYSEHFTRYAVSKIRSTADMPSLSECKDCADLIPEARQRLGGVTRCVECQELEDRRR